VVPTRSKSANLLTYGIGRCIAAYALCLLLPIAVISARDAYLTWGLEPHWAWLRDFANNILWCALALVEFSVYLALRTGRRFSRGGTLIAALGAAIYALSWWRTRLPMLHGIEVDYIDLPQHCLQPLSPLITAELIFWRRSNHFASKRPPAAPSNLSAATATRPERAADDMV